MPILSIMIDCLERSGISTLSRKGFRKMSVDVDVTICILDDDGDPVEGIRVDLQNRDLLNGGFYGEVSTDSNGYVVFNDIPGWQTLDVWIDHEKTDEIGLEGNDDEFTLTWTNPYKYYPEDDDKQNEEDS